MSEKVNCSHCNLTFNKSIMIEDGEEFFCCNGCQGVFHLLSDQGLESFYQKAGSTKLAPPTEQFEDSKNFDAPAFYEHFVDIDSEGFSEVSLIIEGIHCSACVWLNEKMLHKMDGVVEANINYTNNKATIVWADDVVKLSQIIDMIRAIGYNGYPYDASVQEAHANKERKDYYLRMAVALVATMNIMWIAIAQYAGYFTGIDKDVKFILHMGEWALSTPVLFYSGWVFFRGAYYGMKNRVVNMDLLVATGATSTYLYSIYIMFTHSGEAYFDSVSMIITFVLFGKFLEVLSKKNVADTLDTIGKQIPSEVNIIKDEKIVSVKLSDVAVGETVVLTSGEKVLFDGYIDSGSGSFDESNLTGESEPIYREKGDNIISGTVSIDADIHYKTTKDFKHSTLATLVNLLESALSKKPKIEQLANRLSEHFSSIIMALAIITFAAWLFWTNDFNSAFMVGVSVIIIACPCALALATPVATLVGLSIGASRGILFKEAAQLETMANIDVLLLDKTGTITVGKPEVLHMHKLKEFNPLNLYAMVQNSNHPVSIGVAEYIEENYNPKEQIALQEYKQIPASGIVAKLADKTLLGGNAKLLKSHAIEIDFVSDNTMFYYVEDREVVAIFELQDTIKPNAEEILSRVSKRGIEIIMLTGDNEKSAQRVANAVGIKEYYYEQTPEQKSLYVEELHKSGKRVVMVGDGVNDILALANADIGIVMGSGSDIAIDISDVILLDSSLKSLEEAFKVSSTTFGLIKQNLGISLIYNGVTIPLAMAGYIIPLIAAISMSFSSLLVVANAMRIRYRWKKN